VGSRRFPLSSVEFDGGPGSVEPEGLLRWIVRPDGETSGPEIQDRA
jgi:hypothetical protein